MAFLAGNSPNIRSYMVYIYMVLANPTYTCLAMLWTAEKPLRLTTCTSASLDRQAQRPAHLQKLDLRMDTPGGHTQFLWQHHVNKPSSLGRTACERTLNHKMNEPYYNFGTAPPCARHFLVWGAEACQKQKRVPCALTFTSVHAHYWARDKLFWPPPSFKHQICTSLAFRQAQIDLPFICPAHTLLAFRQAQIDLPFICPAHTPMAFRQAQIDLPFICPAHTLLAFR